MTRPIDRTRRPRVRRAGAGVAALAALAALAADAAAQTQGVSNITSLRVTQPAPGEIHEDYRAGSEIVAIVDVHVPVGALATELYFSLEPGDLRPATFAARYAESGALQRCEDAALGTKIEITDDRADLLILDHEWVAGSPPGNGKLSADGQGGWTGNTITAGETGDEAQPQNIEIRKAFAVVCDDTIVEHDEQVTLRAWLSPFGSRDRQSPSGDTAQPLLIIDDDEMGAPRNLALTAGETSVTASWNVGEGNVEPDGYELQYRNAGAGDTGWTDPDPVTGLTTEVSGLTKGETYRFRIRSTKAPGLPSAWSQEVLFEVPEAPTPGAPTALALRADDTNDRILVLTWQPPMNAADFPGLSYEVEFRRDGRAWYSVGVTIDGESASLEAGRAGSYQGRVRSTANDQSSGWQVSNNVTVPEAPTPGPPTALDLRADDTTLVLTWNPPENARDFPGLGYKVEFRKDGRAWSSDGVMIHGDSASLEEGVRRARYEARVQATAGGQTSDWARSNAVEVPDAPTPGPPMALDLRADDTTLVLTWDPPGNAEDFGSIDYAVEFSKDGRAWSSSGVTRPSGRNRATFPGERGASYEARVRATAQGQASAWAVSNSVEVPDAPTPGPPMALDLRADDTTLVLTWDPPGNAEDFGSIDYAVEFSKDGRAWSSSGVTRPSGRNRATFPGERGASYEARVRATAQGQASAWAVSNSVEVPEAPTPGPPTGVEAYLDGGKPAVVWDPPAGGVAVAGYEVQWRTDVDRQWRSVGSTGRKAVLSEVGVAGRTYDFRVRASNDGAPWSAPASVTVPEVPVLGPPTGVEAYLDGSRPTVTWQPPVNAGDITITGYEVEYRTTADRVWRSASCGNLGPSARKCRAPSAVVGQRYEFRVRALSAEASGDWQESSAVTVPTEPVPGRPTGLGVEIDDGEVVVMWEPPGDADETGVTAYEVAAWRYQHPEPGEAANSRVGVQRPYYTAGNIAPGCSLEARVRAVGRVGASAYAYLDRSLRDPWPPGSGICTDRLPGAPRDVRVEPETFDELERTHALTATWKPTGTIAPDFYNVRFTPEHAAGVELRQTVEQRLAVSLPVGRWTVDVQAGVTVEGESGTSGWSHAKRVRLVEPPPFVVGLRGITVMPQATHGCRPANGPVEGSAEAHLSPGPLPYAVEIEAATTAGPEVHFTSVANHSYTVMFPPGEVTHALATWVDCGVEAGEQVEVAIVDITVPNRYAGRVEPDPAKHRVTVGNATPVPALPAAATVVLAGLLAGFGPVRRCRAAPVGSEGASRPRRRRGCSRASASSVLACPGDDAVVVRHDGCQRPVQDDRPPKRHPRVPAGNPVQLPDAEGGGPRLHAVHHHRPVGCPPH